MKSWIENAYSCGTEKWWQNALSICKSQYLNFVPETLKIFLILRICKKILLPRRLLLYLLSFIVSDIPQISKFYNTLNVKNIQLPFEYINKIKIVSNYLLFISYSKIICWDIVNESIISEIDIDYNLLKILTNEYYVVILFKHKIQIKSHNLLTMIIEINIRCRGICLNQHTLYMDSNRIFKLDIQSGKISLNDDRSIEGEGFNVTKNYKLPNKSDGFFFNNGSVINGNGCSVKFFRHNEYSNIKHCEERNYDMTLTEPKWCKKSEKMLRGARGLQGCPGSHCSSCDFRYRLSIYKNNKKQDGLLLHNKNCNWDIFDSHVYYEYFKSLNFYSLYRGEIILSLDFNIDLDVLSYRDISISDKYIVIHYYNTHYKMGLFVAMNSK